MTTFAEPLHLAHGPAWRNRVALAPLTNVQSHPDGTLSEDEIAWLLARARGGFGLVMTAAAYVHRAGNAWVGQLGISDDAHVLGLQALADGIRAAGSVSSVQLHHGGKRADSAASGMPLVAPYDEPAKGAAALTSAQVEGLVEDFASAAARAERAGFDGVELHGAHGYLLCQFLEPRNTREDGWGGDLAGRSRILHEIIAAVRAATGPDFQLGLRLSPERHSMVLSEMVELTGTLLAGGGLDYLDLSLWDVRKLPHEEADRDGDNLLIDAFVGLERHGTAVAVAGAITGAADAQWCLDRGADAVLIGKGAMADHAFAAHALADPAYAAPRFPLTPAHLRGEFLSDRFIDYFGSSWPHLIDRG